MRRVRKAHKGIRVPMRGVQLPDAPLLRHAVFGHEPAVPPPARHEDGDQRRWSSGSGGAVRGVQEKEVRKSVPVHGVRLSGACGVREEREERAPRQRTQGGGEGERAGDSSEAGFSGGGGVLGRYHRGPRRRGWGSLRPEHQGQGWPYPTTSSASSSSLVKDNNMCHNTIPPPSPSLLLPPPYIYIYPRVRVN